MVKTILFDTAKVQIGKKLTSMSAPVVALNVRVGSVSTPGLFGSGLNTVTKRVLPDTERLCAKHP
jgi:hypothetical protein